MSDDSPQAFCVLQLVVWCDSATLVTDGIGICVADPAHGSCRRLEGPLPSIAGIGPLPYWH